MVDDKWLAALDAAIHGEMDRVSQQLTQRVKELAERYETPLPQMVSRVAELEAKVNRHLERMGFDGSDARLQADRSRSMIPEGLGRVPLGSVCEEPSLAQSPTGKADALSNGST